jgi:hypothetical protein
MRGMRYVLSLGAAAICCGLLSQPVLADSTERVSVDNDGVQATGGVSASPSISADGA